MPGKDPEVVHPLVDRAGHPLRELAVAEIFYRGSWHRGRVLTWGRKRVRCEVDQEWTGRVVETWRQPEQIQQLSA